MSKSAEDTRIGRLLDARIAQHTEALVGWSEGDTCRSCKGTGRQLRRGDTGTSLCDVCGGFRVQPGTRGHLVSSQPDPLERERMRRELEVAIGELTWLKGELGV